MEYMSHVTMRKLISLCSQKWIKKRKKILPSSTNLFKENNNAHSYPDFMIQIYFVVFNYTHSHTMFLKNKQAKSKKCNCQRKVIYVQTVLEKLLKGNSCM